MTARSPRILTLTLVASTGLIACFAGDQVHKTATDTGWKQHDIHRAKPPVIEPGGPTFAEAPRDAVVLFDGKDLDAWRGNGGGPAKWKVADGAMEVVAGTGAIQTKESFGDVQLHVEWASPNPPVGTGQDRGNSGIFLMGDYELQVLDSYRADTYADGQAGALYGQYPPLFNASKPPGEWQTYDVAFRRPRFDDAGKLLEPARVTLIHNGVVVQDNEELLGHTNWLKWTPYESLSEKGPIELQDHGHAVKFRNIWLRNLPGRPAPTTEDRKRTEVVALSDKDLDAFTGHYTMGSGTKIEITRDGGHLLVKFPFLPHALVIDPIGPEAFAMPHTDGRFRFGRDKEGRVDKAVFEIGDGVRDLVKVDR